MDVDEAEKKVLSILEKEKCDGEFIFHFEPSYGKGKDHWIIMTKSGRVFIFLDKPENNEPEYIEDFNTGQYADWYYDEWPEEESE